jgi:succinate-semialdehyde dehydrogenase/glutarate-semialdehyde dehydrogenase
LVSGINHRVIDPATGEEIGKVPDMNVEDAKEAIDIASASFKTWSRTTAKERHDLMKKWYDAMLANQEDLATILTWENGKSIAEARGEIVYGSSFIEWFAEEAVRSYGAVIPNNVASQRYITIKQPVGVVGIITPWSK